MMVLLSSCGIFRKSAEQKCLDAQGYINKAIRICPQVAQLDHDTLHITLPGDSSRGSAAMRQEDIDSVAAACEQLREALDAERQLGDIANGVAARIVSRQQWSLDSLRLILAKRRSAGHQPGPPLLSLSVANLRQQLCPFQAIHDSTALHDLRISWSPSGVLYTIRDFPREAAIPTTNQTIKNGPVIVQAGANGWLIALAALGWLMVVVLLLHFISERGMRLKIQDQLRKKS